MDENLSTELHDSDARSAPLPPEFTHPAEDEVQRSTTASTVFSDTGRDVTSLLSTLAQSLLESWNGEATQDGGVPVLPCATQLTKAKESLATTLPESALGGVERRWWSNRSDVVDKRTEELLEHLIHEIGPALPRCSLLGRYYGFITGGVTPAALAGETLAGIWDQSPQVHLPAESISTTLEWITLDWLVQLFRLPDEAWGIRAENGGMATFTTGATASNVVGLAIGREWVIQKAAAQRLGLERADEGSVGKHGILEACVSAGVTKVQVLSTQPHSSLVKAAGVVGIGRAQVISIAADKIGLAIDCAKLEEQAALPGVATILAVSAGEVNTGYFATHGIDEWKRIRAICDRYQVWIHVDGAFGLFGRILDPTADSEEFGEILKGNEGLELADSIATDGHKLLNVPYDCGIFFCRHRGLAEQVFQNGNAAYLASAASQDNDNVPSPLNIGIENSRRFRALPVYATLKTYGRGGHRHMLREQVRFARFVAEWLWDHEKYDVFPFDGSLSKDEALRKTFMIVLFRAKDEQLNKTLVQRIKDTGRIYVSGTTFNGQTACRIAVSNWRVAVVPDLEIVKGVLEECVN
ncbi:MAG: hypothetical protein Q9160_002942 [Pyrenula sp. 1 TL-2023]